MFIPYLQMAKDLGISVRIIEAQGKFKNVHDAPKEALDMFKELWEPYEIYKPKKRR